MDSLSKVMSVCNTPSISNSLSICDDKLKLDIEDSDSDSRPDPVVSVLFCALISLTQLLHTFCPGFRSNLGNFKLVSREISVLFSPLAFGVF